MGFGMGTAARPGGRRPVVATLAAAIALVLVGTPLTASAASAGTRPLDTSSPTVWLCRPGQPADPCGYSRAATTVTATGATSESDPAPAPSAKAFDCFYVYPTVSTEPGDNANLSIQPAEKDAAVAEASRFSQVCNVWAPMYRQSTAAAIENGSFLKPAVINTAYDSLLSAWRDYIAHDNDGRPVVFIGHSQGATLLIKLLRQEVDPSPRLRRQLVSAVILGGNVQVAVNGDVGGSFTNIPTCSSAAQTGCVIAYSTFASTPPSDSLFGRAGKGVSLQAGQTTSTGQQVACVNPVTFSSAPGTLQPYFLSATSKKRKFDVVVTTPWVSYPSLYTAQCQDSQGASWLQVTAAPGDPRPLVHASLGPEWGYHLDDVNLALGDLVADVAVEEAAYR
jgi:hypothetical protein